MPFPTELPVDNDWYLALEDLTYVDAVSGLETPATGWDDLHAYLAAAGDEDATPIHVSLDLVLGEDPDRPACYRGVFPGASLTAQLVPGYEDTAVFLHLKRQQNYHTVTSLTVRRRRSVA